MAYLRPANQCDCSTCTGGYAPRGAFGEVIYGGWKCTCSCHVQMKTENTNQPAPLPKPAWKGWALLKNNKISFDRFFENKETAKWFFGMHKGNGNDRMAELIEVEIRPISEEAKEEYRPMTETEGLLIAENEKLEAEIERLRIEVKTYRDLWQGKNYREEFENLLSELRESNRLHEFYKGLSEELEQKLEKAREALEQWYYLWDKNFIGWDNGEPLSKVTAESFSKLLDITRDLSSPAEQESKDEGGVLQLNRHRKVLASFKVPIPSPKQEQEKKDEEPTAEECLEWLAKSRAWLCEAKGLWCVADSNGKTPLEAIRNAMKQERKE